MRPVTLTLLAGLLPAIAQAQSPRPTWQETLPSGTARITYEGGQIEHVPLELRIRQRGSWRWGWSDPRLEYRGRDGQLPRLVFQLNARSSRDQGEGYPHQWQTRIAWHPTYQWRDAVELIDLATGERIAATEWGVVDLVGTWEDFDQDNFRDIPEHLDITWQQQTPGLPRWEQPIGGIQSIELLDVQGQARLPYAGLLVPEPGASYRSVVVLMALVLGYARWQNYRKERNA